MKTLVGAAEPEPRPYATGGIAYGPMPYLVGAGTCVWPATTTSSANVTVTLSFARAPELPSVPYRTQAFVDRRPEIEAGPSGADEGKDE